jgi:hypothetical protein
VFAKPCTSSERRTPPIFESMLSESRTSGICKPALNVTRAQRDKLLICAYRLFKLEIHLKHELN